MSVPLFSTYLKEIDGLRWLADGLELLSGPGPRILASMPWISREEEISERMHLNEAAIGSLGDESLAAGWEGVAADLMQIRDIRGTIGQIESGSTPDDIGLFEIKGVAISAISLRENTLRLLPEFGIFPDLSPVLDILDPDRSRARSFHIYDSYSPALAEMRRRLRSLEPHTREAESLRTECMEMEGEIRRKLGELLRPLCKDIAAALDMAGRLDILRASAELALRRNLVVARCSEGISLTIRGMVNPIVEESLSSRGALFQPVDVCLESGVTLLTGANMSGKSVVLKSLAMVQAMFQFGFPVPAAYAELPTLDGVLVSIGDSQSEREGLSSYAAEMLRIDSILGKVKEGNYLVLADEPARTTNPEEGEAIAGALTELFGQTDSICVLTTHYTVRTACRRLRVRGLREFAGDKVTPAELSRMIDYTLAEDHGEPPREALRVASMLGIDRRLIALSSEYINKRQNAKK